MSGIALLAGLAGTAPALAACSDNGSATDLVVTCDTSAPNPDTAGVQDADAANSVTVIVTPGAGIAVNDVAAISILAPETTVEIDQGTIATIGDDAPGVFIAGGDDTTQTIEITGSTLTSNGANSTLIGIGVFGGDSNHNLLVENSTLTAIGDGSGGVVIGGLAPGGELSSSMYELNDVTISTDGADAPALFFGTGNALSVRSVILDDVTIVTGQARSDGVYIGSLGSTSAMETQARNLSITTYGDDSRGFYSGAAGRTSARQISWNDVEIETFGDRSAAFTLEQAGGTCGPNVTFDCASNSVQATTMADFVLSTWGDQSAGIIIGTQADIGSTAVNDMTRIDVTTRGEDSIGVFWGGIVGSFSSLSQFIFQTTVRTEGNNSAGVVLEGLLAPPSNPEGADRSDYTVSISDLIVETLGDDSAALVIGGVGIPSTVESVVLLDGIDLTTSGARSHGLVIGEGLGTDNATSTSDLVISDTVTATTSGADAHALIIRPNATLTLDGSVAGGITNIDNFTATGAGGRSLLNEGTIVAGSSGIVIGAGLVGNIANAGTINSGGPVAIQYGAADDIFELRPGGVVNGTVLAGAGTDTFILGGDGSDSFDVGLIDTQYDGFDLFEKQGASIWVLEGSNTDFGNWRDWSLAGGTLIVDADMGSWMFANNSASATIGGSGTVGDIWLDAGGRLAPGSANHGIGHLTATHLVYFDVGSVFEVDVAANGQSDRLTAPEVEIEAGSRIEVHALDAATSYTDGQTYLIIDAATPGGYVFGQFDGATMLNESAFISASVNYVSANPNSPDPDQVWLRLNLDRDFTTVAETFNQRQAAAGLVGLEQSGDGLAVFNAIAMMNEEQARRAFDLASGEVHALAQHVIDQTFGLFSRTLRYQGVGGIGAGNVGAQVFTATPMAYGQAPSAPGVTAIDGATTSGYADSRVQNAWIAPLGGFGRVDADGNAAELDWWNAGIAGGYEGTLDVTSGNAVAGFGLGYIRSHGKVDDRLSSFDSDGFYVGAYGAWADGPWSVAGSLAYGANRVSTTRNIAFINRTAEADYWTHSLGFSGEAAYGFNVAPATRIAPLVTLDAGWSGHGRFTETGAGALNLTGASESWTRLDTGFGLAVTHTIPTETGAITLEGRAVWEHAFADVVPSQSLSFAASPVAFTVNGPDAGRDRFRLGAGLAWDVSDDVTVRGRYDGVFSGNQANHTASVGFNVRF